MEEEMRLKVAESVAEIPGPRLHIHNVSQGERNRNQQDKLADSTTVLHSTQWASNYVTSPNATLLKDHLTNNGSNFNNNIAVSLQQQQQQQQLQLQQRVHRTSYSASSDLLSESSPDDSLGDYDADAQQSSSSLDVSPQGDEYRCFSHEDLSDSDSLSDDGNCPGELHPRVSGRGIVNPNYPGFQHLAHQLHHSDTDDADEDVVDEQDNNNLYNNNNNNNNDEDGDVAGAEIVEEVIESKIDSVNHLDSVENFQKAFYDKPKFNIPLEADNESVFVDSTSPVLGLENLFNVQISEAIVDSVSALEGDIESLLVEGNVGRRLVNDEVINGAETRSVEFTFVDEKDLESISLESNNIITLFDVEGITENEVVRNVEFTFVENEAIDAVFSAAECAETKLTERDYSASVATVTTETAFVVYPEVQYVETAFVDAGSIENIFPEEEEEEEREKAEIREIEGVKTAFFELEREALSPQTESVNVVILQEENFANLVTEAENLEIENIEAALADEKLNETLNADLKNIQNAFAKEDIFDHKSSKHAKIISFTENSFVDISLDDLEETITPLKTVESEFMSYMMAATASMEESKQIPIGKLEDAFLSNVTEDIPGMAEGIKGDVLLKNIDKKDLCSKQNIQHGDSNRVTDDREKFIKENQTSNEKEKDEDSVIPRKKEKMEINYSMKKNRHSIGSVKGVSEISLPLNITGGVVRRREFGPRGRDIMMAGRRSMPSAREKKRSSPEMLGGFDVYNIETAMPMIDLDAIESHLKAAKEEDRRRRNDREEIRKRLAMGSDADEYYGGERPGRKPSLQARLQSGMNLQICFMNETVSDTESPSSDTEPALSPIKLGMEKTIVSRNYALPLKSPNASAPVRTRPSTSMLTLPLRQEPDLTPMTEADFFARQARLQAEARMALAQAKEMAHMQMEIERQRQKKSPITEMVRSSLEKVGIPFPEDRRRVSRQILTEMNLAQLQVIVNDLHTQIEMLNESLVKFLMNRDDLHMEQDSMLVDIEDLTRYLGAKEQPMKDQKDQPLLPQQNNNVLFTTNKPKLNRIAGMVKK